MNRDTLVAECALLLTTNFVRVENSELNFFLFSFTILFYFLFSLFGMLGFSVISQNVTCHSYTVTCHREHHRRFQNNIIPYINSI